MVFPAPAAYSIGKSIRPATTPLFNNPGPGAYNAANTQTFKPTSNQFYIKKRQQTSKKHLVETKIGPGAYNLSQKQLWNAPKFTMPKANNYYESHVQITPGPQDYKTNEKPTKFNKFSFPKSPKTICPNIGNPGPGSYNPKNPLFYLEGKPVKFPRGSRSNLEGNKRIPGPGSYNLKFEKILKGHPAWSFEQNEKYEKKMGGMPGPGSYKVKSCIGDAPHYLFYNIKKKIPSVSD